MTAREALDLLGRIERGEVRPSRARRHLLALLSHVEPDVRIRAIELSDDEVLEGGFFRKVMEIASRDLDARARCAALETLEFALSTDELLEGKRAARHEQRAREAREFLLAVARSQEADPDDRWVAVRSLGPALDDPEIATLIRSWAGSSDPARRVAAVCAMGRSPRPPEWEQAVLAATRDPDWTVVCEALQAIGQNGFPTGWDVLRRRAGDCNPEVRRAVAEALEEGTFGEEGTSVLEALARDPDPDVAKAAREALARIEEDDEDGENDENSSESALDKGWEVLEEFAESPEFEALDAGEREVAGFGAQALVSYLADYVNKTPERLSPEDMREYLLDYYPRKCTAANSLTRRVPEGLGTFCRFLNRTGRLADGKSGAVLRTITELQEPFLQRTRDRRNFGPAKSALSGIFKLLRLW